MATIRFTHQMARHRAIPEMEGTGADVRAVLRDAFAVDPMLGAYVLDEQGRLRKHVNIFVDGDMVTDRIKLSDPVNSNSEIYIMQALSGG